MQLTIWTAVSFVLCESVTPTAYCRDGPAPMQDDLALGTVDDDLEFETSKGVKPITSFEGMGLKDGLLKGVYQFGFEKPSAIQQRAIMPIINSKLLHPPEQPKASTRISNSIVWTCTKGDLGRPWSIVLIHGNAQIAS